MAPQGGSPDAASHTGSGVMSQPEVLADVQGYAYLTTSHANQFPWRFAAVSITTQYSLNNDISPKKHIPEATELKVHYQALGVLGDAELNKFSS